jgi:TPR repeat protein
VLPSAAPGAARSLIIRRRVDARALGVAPPGAEEFARAEDIRLALRRRAARGEPTDTPADEAARRDMRRLYEAAAARGHLRAQTEAAVCFRSGLGGPCDFARYHELGLAAARGGDVAALGLVGSDIALGWCGFAFDHVTGLRMCRDAFLAGEGACGASMYILDLSWDSEGIALGLRLARDFYPQRLRAAEEGDAYAQLDVAYAYEDGTGVERDMRLAAAWTMRAAEQGYADGLHAAGWMLLTGRPDVPRDTPRALQLLQRAADLHWER